MRAIEEGRPVGIHVTPALVHQKHVAIPRALADELQTAVGHTIEAAVANGGAAEGTVAHRPGAHRPSGPSPRVTGEVRIQDPGRDDGAVRALYERFAAARLVTGEGAVGLEKFQGLIAQQTTRILAERGGSAVDFRVETKDGKVSLKAKLVK